MKEIVNDGFSFFLLINSYNLKTLYFILKKE